MRVLMVDDHMLFLQGMKTLLLQIAPELDIDLADTAEQAMNLAGTADYGLVLLDWHLDGSDGEDCIHRLREVGCTARIVVLSGETQPALIRRTIEVGAAGFIAKKYGSQVMLAALQVVIAGGIYLPADALRDARSPGRAAKDLLTAAPALRNFEEQFGGLTKRQTEVWRAAARGLPNKLIARQLGIEESTVKTHLSVVYSVLGVSNRTEAAYQASREGYRVG